MGGGRRWRTEFHSAGLCAISADVLKRWQDATWRHAVERQLDSGNDEESDRRCLRSEAGDYRSVMVAVVSDRGRPRQVWIRVSDRRRQQSKSGPAVGRKLLVGRDLQHTLLGGS